MSTVQKSLLSMICLLLCAVPATAQDWSQWRGSNRDGVAGDFEVPAEWPKDLVKKWSVDVGNGIATPSLSGDKIYVMGLQDGQEVMRCLNAETGEEIWKDEYKARAASGPASGFPGTRSSPAVGEGMVATLGVDGTVSCWDAESGKLLWQNDDNRGKVPRFSTSSSPVVVDGLCIVQYGSDRQGGVVAYDLKTGDQKWEWTESGSAYGSPVLMTIGDQKVVLVPAADQLVALSVADGSSLWSMDYVQGRYNAATPVVDGQMVYLAGPNRGITALELTAAGGKLSSAEKWRNEDIETTVMYNSPVLVQGNLFGLSNANQLFCVNVETGEKAWNEAMPGTASQTPPQQSQRGGRGGDAAGRGGPPGGGNRGAGGTGRTQQDRGGRPPGRGGQGRRRRGGGGRGGYGSIVSVGPVLFGLTPKSELLVYESNATGFKELARYKVSESKTYAYPVPVGNRIYIKDENSLTMWTLK